MHPSSELTYFRGIFGILFACPGYLNQGHAEMRTSSNRKISSGGESDEQGVILKDNNASNVVSASAALIMSGQTRRSAIDQDCPQFLFL